MKSHTSLRVRYSETDQMKIVHHSEYVKWFEVGRTDYIRELDKSYGEIENQGFYLPVIGVDVHYKMPAKYEDLVTIETEIAEYNGVRIRFHYKAIRDRDQVLLAEGYTEHCWTTTSMRPVKLQKHWPELHQKIVESMEEK
ncbi:MAG: acyl-CoA thioesterase [Tuberibacillus sp.]